MLLPVKNIIIKTIAKIYINNRKSNNHKKVILRVRDTNFPMWNRKIYCMAKPRYWIFFQSCGTSERLKHCISSHLWTQLLCRCIRDGWYTDIILMSHSKSVDEIIKKKRPHQPTRKPWMLTRAGVLGVWVLCLPLQCLLRPRLGEHRKSSSSSSPRPPNPHPRA